MPRNFASNYVVKTAGILDVFQGFYKHKLEQKNGHFAEREFLEVPGNLLHFDGLEVLNLR